ncbi:nicotinamidase-related amidase [Xanthobacter flavus]|uniref:Cysteine hydrolase n=1 Tax=Xanthobacter flavus TaxID=281 RepID=A0A9W6CDQ8_XANFL|nr:cysteine hydrolase [Xanthobacter flavus]MDR6333892.1 nicotinamidase-related amidase [Xanthobacter flavus]GLI20353.1 cysteine hydrolase [Xanthobacter flavus]
MGQGLRGAIGPRAAHLCVDMQHLFGPGGPWPAPWAPRILPVIVELTGRAPARSLFTRFIPPHTAEALPGSWRQLYSKWREVTRQELAPELLDLVPELRRFTPPARLIDKTRYSAFSSPALLPTLAHLGADTLVLSGAETDVCILATLFDAVDYGYRVVVARDAVCSSSDAGHDAVLAMLSQRLSAQVEVADAEEILSAWRTADAA